MQKKIRVVPISTIPPLLRSLSLLDFPKNFQPSLFIETAPPFIKFSKNFSPTPIYLAPKSNNNYNNNKNINDNNNKSHDVEKIVIIVIVITK